MASPASDKMHYVQMVIKCLRGGNLLSAGHLLEFLVITAAKREEFSILYNI
jgi:hypothetical protein